MSQSMCIMRPAPNLPTAVNAVARIGNQTSAVPIVYRAAWRRENRSNSPGCSCQAPSAACAHPVIQ
jgi:hypothetical protein